MSHFWNSNKSGTTNLSFVLVYHGQSCGQSRHFHQTETSHRRKTRRAARGWQYNNSRIPTAITDQGIYRTAKSTIPWLAPNTSTTAHQGHWQSNNWSLEPQLLPTRSSTCYGGVQPHRTPLGARIILVNDVNVGGLMNCEPAIAGNGSFKSRIPPKLVPRVGVLRFGLRSGFPPRPTVQYIAWSMQSLVEI